MKNKLSTIVQETGLEQEKSSVLMKRFGGFFEDAKRLAIESELVIITSETDLEGMKKAKEKRLVLQKVRTGADKVRKELKSQVIKEANAIQGIFNEIKDVVQKAEKHLKLQEEYAKIKKEERLQKRYVDRVEKLMPYVRDVSVYSIKEMSDESFDYLLEEAKKSFQAVKDQEEKARKEAKEKEEAEAKENERMRKENEKLKKQADIRRKADAKKREIERKKLKAERVAKEKAESELREKNEAIRKEKEDKEEKARQLLLAPDKEKLYEFRSDLFDIDIPEVKSKEANLVISKVKYHLQMISIELRKGIK